MAEDIKIPADTDPANQIAENAEVMPSGADTEGEDDSIDDEDDLTPLDVDTGANLDAAQLAGQDDDREYDVVETFEKTTGERTTGF
ncbi:hypothetical protein [Asticcacaulis sp. AND118]|uniref:hypothetical protein n=1 Tax=Asticcacaulis sp. AND118 TaxID=2840468 RepID=UPI001D0008EF|nr:hypothetical protein [Asticcacaulis sp. AND118]UDF03538.1 hypothetical protein LH365_00420 [Asticcacaulis sp. AND118]